jgi:hypothetical protein
MNRLTLSVLSKTFTVCKFDQQSKIPDWLWTGSRQFISSTKTDEELSIVCDQSIIPEENGAISIERDWRALKVEGPLDFSLTGILSSLLQPLAEQKISIFAVSTYNTDYILVKEANLICSIEALRKQCIVRS